MYVHTVWYLKLKVDSVKPGSVLFRLLNIVLALCTGLYLCIGNFSIFINWYWSVLTGYVSCIKDFKNFAVSVAFSFTFAVWLTWHIGR